MLKIPLFHMRKPKNKLSSKSTSRPNVPTLVLGWKSSSVTKCPHTLAVRVHPPGRGTGPATRRERQGQRGDCTNTITGCEIHHHCSCVHHFSEANAALSLLLQTSSWSVCGNTENSSNWGIWVFSSQTSTKSPQYFQWIAQVQEMSLWQCRELAPKWNWPLLCSHLTRNWLL